jgi:hypothetical protein
MVVRIVPLFNLHVNVNVQKLILLTKGGEGWWMDGSMDIEEHIIQLCIYMNMLACSYYVDEVIINAPWEVTGDIMLSYTYFSFC